MKPTRKITRDTLFEILSFARPHESECERRFVREFIDTVPGITRDKFGNRMVRIGTAPVLWSSHVDTVAKDGGFQHVDFDPETGLASLRNGKPGMSLGADDGAGVWIMLAMIERGVEGLYVFHRGEECGCLGSNWIATNTPDLLKGIDAAIAFDRQGYEDIITHQSYGMTASDEFAYSLAGQLNRTKGFNYRPDDTGILTDTNEYADLVAECSNLSVGYFRNHGPEETLDVYYVEALLEAVCQLDTEALAIKRCPGEGGWRDWMGGGGGQTASRDTPDDLVEMVKMAPEAAAALLDRMGVDADYLWDFVWEFDQDGPDPNEELDKAFERAWKSDRSDEDVEASSEAA